MDNKKKTDVNQQKKELNEKDLEQVSGGIDKQKIKEMLDARNKDE